MTGARYGQGGGVPKWKGQWGQLGCEQGVEEALKVSLGELDSAGPTEQEDARKRGVRRDKPQRAEPQLCTPSLEREQS